MMHHIRKNVAGVFMVISKLGAAVIVREGHHLFYRRVFMKFFFELLLNALRDSVDTPDRRYDPEFVSDTGTAVFSSVAFETSLFRGFRHFRKIGLIRILQQTFKICLEIRMVYQSAFLYGRQQMADRETVFNDVLPL